MQRSYTDGEVFHYRGAPLTLRTVPDQSSRTRVEENTIIVAAGPQETVRKRLLYWYTSETEKIVRRLLPVWTRRMSLRPRTAEVRYTRTRWGSCTASGNLYFNSRISMMTEDIAEYIVVHELCHLLHLLTFHNAYWLSVQLSTRT